MANLMDIQVTENELSKGLDTAFEPVGRPSTSDRPSTSMTSTERIYRHRLPVRIGHWLNVLCLFILIMSGLQIFNAHPTLYWGDRSDRDRPLLSIRQ